MYLLELILAVITAPFWFPILLLVVGVSILLGGIILLITLFLCLCLIGSILTTIYNVHRGLIEARKSIIKEIGNNMSWLGLTRLILNRYRKQVREAREFKRQKAKEEEQIDES
jgi:hypothetical protein